MLTELVKKKKKVKIKLNNKKYPLWTVTDLDLLPEKKVRDQRMTSKMGKLKTRRDWINRGCCTNKAPHWSRNPSKCCFRVCKKTEKSGSK